MSHEPCYDIRFHIHAAKTSNPSSDSEKENLSPCGVGSPYTPFRGRGRGLLNIQRQREQNALERKFFAKFNFCV